MTTPVVTWHPEAALVGALLGAHGLPVEDITAAMLPDFAVASRDGEPCGVVGLQRDGDVALLRSLAVVHRARGQGLGATLVGLAEARAADAGVRSLYLLTTDAANFFARLGYAPVARADAPEPIRATAQFSSICSSATLMRKVIAP
ncbi:MAG: arsenic resistance N-acetyltransferase ArsN2 [Vicinamibacterales bacterium]